MIKKLSKMDQKIFKIMNNGILFSLIFCIAGIGLLLFYKSNYINYDLIEASTILFQSGIFFIVQFIICGVSFDMILKKRKGDE